MSEQFGRCSFYGQLSPQDGDYLRRVGDFLAPYGPDGAYVYSADGFEILYHAFHTTKHSRREKQPFLSSSGAVLTWSGRLDNRRELIDELNPGLSLESSDVAIVGAAYDRWTTGCFSRLIGDWAVSIWNPTERALLLAKDFVGTRHLYYVAEEDHIAWSSVLDPLVLLHGKTWAVDTEYIAGWLSLFPAAHLTPYVGIHSVSPGTFVRFVPGRQTVHKYWDFDPRKPIRYSTDAEYEEHFRIAFTESVRRRLCSDTPILAELSGGMDSSSIVCMADRIIAEGKAEAPRLDTLSYYDDQEPNWNERPYFSRVEAKRGRIGCHIPVGFRPVLGFDDGELCLTPASSAPRAESVERFAACMSSQGNRVLLSGIGGDEVTGGVPTPIPELGDLLARARFFLLAHQLKLWALNKRKPWLKLLTEAVLPFLSPVLTAPAQHMHLAPWLCHEFVRRNHAAVMGYTSRLKFFGPLPSFQDNLSALDTLKRQMESIVPAPSPPHETRYPFLDRDLLEFLFAIPREQLVRPGHRRSLMRRALAGLVPDEILNRRRKAYVVHRPLQTISRELPVLLQISRDMIGVSLGIVNQGALSDALRKVGRGGEIQISALMRLLRLERWLKSALNHRLLDLDKPFESDLRPIAQRLRRIVRAVRAGS